VSFEGKGRKEKAKERKGREGRGWGKEGKLFPCFTLFFFLKSLIFDILCNYYIE